MILCKLESDRLLKELLRPILLNRPFFTLPPYSVRCKVLGTDFTPVPKNSTSSMADRCDLVILSSKTSEVLCRWPDLPLDDRRLRILLVSFREKFGALSSFDKSSTDFELGAVGEGIGLKSL